MGYTTDFSGQFDLDKPLTEAHAAYLRAFATTRRMKRNASKLPADPIREAAGLPPGPEGAYFVGDGKNFGQDSTPDILDYNRPPVGQPSLWCQWVPNDKGDAIEWDGGEKFYEYIAWIKYLIDNFLKPWGYVVNGEVTWSGEDSGDLGKIIITNNHVKAAEAVLTYPGL